MVESLDILVPFQSHGKGGGAVTQKELGFTSGRPRGSFGDCVGNDGFAGGVVCSDIAIEGRERTGLDVLSHFEEFDCWFGKHFRLQEL